MAEQRDVLSISLKLRGQIKTQFLEIKDAKGLTNNTEVCRLIINEYHELILPKGASS